MRKVIVAMLLFLANEVRSQDILINEVKASPLVPGSAVPIEASDWVELYNASDRTVDLLGMRLVIAGRQHVFGSSLFMPPGGYQVLFCDGKPKEGPDHLGFKLPRDGGALLLVDRDGGHVMDLFTWPFMDGGPSIGRMPDGGQDWSFFHAATPGAPNPGPTAQERVQHRCPKPEVAVLKNITDRSAIVQINTAPGCAVRYTLDGRSPTTYAGAIADAPFPVSANAVIRAVSFGKGRLDGPERCEPVILCKEPGDAMSLTVDPGDLWSDSTGIAVAGPLSNHTRRGRAWERPGWLHLPDASPVQVGVRISGSGSRGLAKQSYKLYARASRESGEEAFAFIDGSRCNEGMLRADASPDAFLRNRFLELLVRRYGLHVAVQPAEVRTLYLNGAYWGMYRWMPPKDAQWLRQVASEEALDVLEGPAAAIVSGNDRHYRMALECLLNGAPVDSLETLIDLRSLIDLAVIDLWTGRADHDLNVRCYRPRRAGGRWRWVLFDMDLWSNAADNVVERMCSAGVPEAPFVPQLLRDEQLQQQLLARLTALQATTFTPDHARRIVDSLHETHSAELAADHERWRALLERDGPEVSRDRLVRFLEDRPEHLFAHLAKHTGRRVRSVVIEVPPADQAVVLLDGTPLPSGKREVRCFSGVPVMIEAIAAPGHQVIGWKGLAGDGRPQRVDLSRTGRIAARVVPLLP